MARYAGTPLSSDWDRLQRRRKLEESLMENALSPYQGTQHTGSGPYRFAVDDRLGTGISKIGQAIVSGLSKKRSDWEEKELERKYGEKEQESITKIKELMSDPTRRYEAIAELTTDPYLKDNKVATALINTQAYGGRGVRPYVRSTPGPEGILQSNTRTGEVKVTPWNQVPGYGGQFAPYPQDISHQGQLAGTKEGAKQTQKDIHEPGRAQETKRREVIGTATGTAQVDVPKTEESYEKSLSLIDELTAHPGFKDAVGFPDNPFTLGGLVPWTDAYGFRKRLDQLTGRGFMEVFPTLKGGGQITEIEGTKAQTSINRMSAATTEKEFLAAADDFKRELFRLKKVVADRAGTPAGEPPVTGNGWSDADEARLNELEAQINATNP